MPVSDTQKRAITKYLNEKVYQLSIKFVRSLDADIIERLNEEESKQGYIKRLIREDIERQKEKE